MFISFEYIIDLHENIYIIYSHNHDILISSSWHTLVWIDFAKNDYLAKRQSFKKIVVNTKLTNK